MTAALEEEGEGDHRPNLNDGRQEFDRPTEGLERGSESDLFDPGGSEVGKGRGGSR